MGEVEHVSTPEGARRLAAHLLDARRSRPVVVVSHGVGREQAPWIDAEHVSDGVGDYAEVFVMPTGDVSWAFGASMPPQTQVYGDAARVYGTDLAWVSRPRASRLYLCLGPDQGARIAASLEADAMQGALAAGLLEVRSTSRRAVTGVVRGVLAGRGIVVGEFGQAAVRPELAVPSVSVERLVQPGQVVTGEWVESDGLLDVRDQVRPADTALADYGIGDAVLVRVSDVGRDRAVVEPYPGLRVEIGVGGITGNVLDDPRDLMTVGEVLVAHVVRAGRWILSLLDVDDDEQVRPAPSLLPGGPPWLEVEEPVVPQPAAPWAPPDVEPDAPAVVVIEGTDARSETTAPGATSSPRRPSPLLLDPRRRNERDVVVAPVPVLEPKPAAAAPRLLHLEREARVLLERQLSALRLENAQLVSRLHRLEQEHDRAVADVERKRTETRDLRKRLQRHRSGIAGRAASTDRFLEAEAAFRHDVYVAWVEMIPAAEKSTRLLPTTWVVGPDFIPSLDAVDGIARSKVVEVVVHVLTGHAESMPGRDTHRLRVGAGGDDPWVERRPGEYCWRVALQQHAPSARRLHFWRRGDDIELSRVALHDEMRP